MSEDTTIRRSMRLAGGAFITVGSLLLILSAVLAWLVDSRFVIIAGIGSAFLVTGLVNGLLRYLEREEIITATLRSYFERNMPDVINAVLTSPEFREQIETDRRENVRFTFGLTEIYEENERMVRECIEKKEEFCVFAVGGELDDPDEGTRLSLHRILSQMDTLASLGVEVRRLQVTNAPLRWLTRIHNIVAANPDFHFVQFTDDGPFVSQVIIRGQEEVGVIPTETDLEQPIGEFFRKSGNPRRDPVSAYRKYFYSKFQQNETVDAEAVLEKIERILAERRRIVPRLVAYLFMLSGISQREGQLARYDRSHSKWREGCLEFRKALRLRVVEDRYGDERAELQAELGRLCAEEQIVELADASLMDLVTPVDLGMYSEVLESAACTEDEIQRALAREDPITVEDARQRAKKWAADAHVSLTWAPPLTDLEL